MVYQEEKKVNSSEYWYFILPICILLLLGFFVYVLFHMSSIQTVDSRKIFQIVRQLSPHKLSHHSR
jgi:hypothetical protein